MYCWLIIAVLTLLLLISIGALLLLHWDIRKMTNQLEGIIENFGTNELVRTNTQSKSLKQFIKKINQLIYFYKQDQQNKEKREQELKQEITNISHDLRTPLTSMKGFSELLTDPSLTETQRKEFLAIVQKKIDNLTMMVDVFYELSQIGSMDNHMVMERQLLDQSVAETVLMFYDDFEQKQLKVHVEEASVSPVLADQKATNRIIINIIQNALRYAKSYFTIHLIEDENFVRLRATNDVEAFNHKELSHIFDRTFTMDTSRTGGQLGLGLHIVQKLINKQGGTVTADVVNEEFIMEVCFKKWS
ncbi:sensor histidine kinase [Virgibacillus halodenitrificans]|uniref:histidine kinase n=1 Tax=Virgibacillus halodenitrificans TaxID=1482 RepID=A0ABR7VLD9_VIRHA|nr:HAMP domain-containing sensor histidine kinase [Virgibacillus halodenitrificans]MBD1222080.1 HAMP domain-containing histidine kinase [Virgibacillus halodenitrificans]MCJ0930588.1 HAMP domain-containing histidine kinase [Virgibacillus halodenitrificans]MYL45715.1 GHKL domain-containing protein [Virgibacillus halodenitrificans]